MIARRTGANRRGPFRRLARAGALLGSSIALSATLLVPQPALADPPLTVAEAKAQITQLETEAAAIDQEYVGVQEKLTAGKAELKDKQADVKAQTAKVAKMRQIVGQVALAQFQNRSLDTAAQIFFTEDTDGFLNQISTVEKISENQNASLQDYQAGQAELADLERSSEADVATLKAQEQVLTKLRASSEKKIAESKAVLSRLSREEQQLIATEEAKARQQAETDATTGNTTDPTTTDPGTTDGSSRGARALAFAKSQIGKPYRFSAAGPNAYDCSGLMLAAWRSVGVSLPRTSQAQYGAGRAVSRSELQPGDLVFFYSGISHVAIYAGNGTIVHAPRPGKSVEYSKLSYMPFVGARRPG